MIFKIIFMQKTTEIFESGGMLLETRDGMRTYLFFSIQKASEICKSETDRRGLFYLKNIKTGR